jgi:type II secretory pathway pseudopilin PulG
MMNVECRMKKSVVSSQWLVANSQQPGVHAAHHGLRTTVRSHSSFIIHHSSFSTAGFTMVEIAISLAVIGFALVAIVGILPIGMGMQKQNRQETIINSDASVYLDAIRNGEQGLDYLTNYVIGITNDMVRYDTQGNVKQGPIRVGYWPTGSTFGGPKLDNGYHIIGLLSTPKYVPVLDRTQNPPALQGYWSNHVVAYMRSLSGPASEKFPQSDTSVKDLAFSYRLIPEIITYGTYYNPVLVPGRPVGNFQPLLLQSNLSELRLTFRWPLVDPRGKAGPGQQSFRCTVGGFLQITNDPGYSSGPPVAGSPYTLYFFQPRTYVNTNSP